VCAYARARRSSRAERERERERVAVRAATLMSPNISVIPFREERKEGRRGEGGGSGSPAPIERVRRHARCSASLSSVAAVMIVQRNSPRRAAMPDNIVDIPAEGDGTSIRVGQREFPRRGKHEMPIGRQESFVAAAAAWHARFI